MKNIFLLLLLTVTLPSFGQEEKRNVRQEVAALKNSLTRHHVAPRPVDDLFSADLFDKLLTDLDPDKIYFTATDVAWLEPFRSRLDDEINHGETGFLTRFQERYRSGLERSERLITGFLSAPVNWEKEETYDPRATRATDEQMLADRHRQWLKHQILERLTDLLERDAFSGEHFFDDNIGVAIDYVHLMALRPLTRMLRNPQALENKVTTSFLQSIARVFDAHSDFFSARDFEDFRGALSTEDYYFGFTLGEDGKGNIVISALAPGGAAWKSGVLHVSDLLLAIKWEGEEAIDLSGMDIGDVNRILDSNGSDMIEMTIRTVEGVEKQLTLRKEKLEAEQDVVQSFILQGDVKTGYIYLPDFYTRWDDEQEGGHCANDVAREIIKLKREGIEGLILDLRFNGGGSLYEARAMAGIFIDEGPLAVVSTAEQKGVLLKDMNRGTIYDGPLVIMVNGASASASEVLAGTIQDYNRGLIVGSRTYGKATGQNIFPLQADAARPDKNNLQSKAGYIKVTTQRLYRVTGKSAQQTGVIPDVVLPDIFMALQLRESAVPFTLPQDSIVKKTYFKPLQTPDRKTLRERSAQRISRHAGFQALQETLRKLQEEVRKNDEPKSLVWKEYLKEAMAEKTNQAVVDKKKESGQSIYTVSNGLTKEQRLVLDDYARTINERWIDILATDIHLQETYQILMDHISFIKKS